jgi:hypothetical protein
MSQLLPPETCPYDQVATRLRVTEDARRMLLDRYIGLGAIDSLLPIESAALVGTIGDLTRELGVLENRECDQCGGQGGTHVHECSTLPTSDCECH